MERSLESPFKEVLEDRLVVVLDAPETITESGIYLPDNAQRPPQIGTVIAVGPGKTLSNGLLKPMRCAVGDRILFSKWMNQDITIDGKDYSVLSEDHVYVVLNETKVASPA